MTRADSIADRANQYFIDGAWVDADSGETLDVNNPASGEILGTVAFIAPGPPNPPITQVLYVGVTYTPNGPFRSEVPAVSSRSLDSNSLFEIAETAVTTGTEE